MAPFHDRMPVILRPRDYNRWMEREITEQPPVDLLRPFDAEEMEMHPANPAEGNVRNNGPEILVEPSSPASLLPSSGDRRAHLYCAHRTLAVFRLPEGPEWTSEMKADIANLAEDLG